jgi:hypothetical protein
LAEKATGGHEQGDTVAPCESVVWASVISALERTGAWATIPAISAVFCLSLALSEGRSPDGVIGSATVAEAVAFAYLVSVYGKEMIRREMSLRAILRDGVWTVAGSPPAGHMFIGGLAEIKLCQRNGHVLSIIHHK